MDSQWSAATEFGLEPIREFLYRHGPESCNIWDKLFQYSNPEKGWQTRVKLWVSAGIIRGVLYRNEYGLTLPLFDQRKHAKQAALEIGSNDARIFALVGRLEDTAPFLETWAKPRIQWRYTSYVIEKPRQVCTEKNSHVLDTLCLDHENIRYRTALPSDADALLDLEWAYQVEEVLAPGMSFQAAGSLFLLKEQIKKNQLIIAEAKGSLLGKAGINAVGPDYLQLGGVYVSKALRGRGIGYNLTNLICETALRRGKGLSLFVRDENLAAQKVYKKTGFTLRSPFMIAYY